MAPRASAICAYCTLFIIHPLLTVLNYYEFYYPPCPIAPAVCWANNDFYYALRAYHLPGAVPSI